VITYFDTSMLMKLVIDDESYWAESERLWLESDYVVCAEIGYAEACSALGSARRHHRLDATGLQTAKNQLELLWEQLSIVVVDTALVRAAGDVAERDGLRGYDAVHLAAAITGQATVMASADRHLVKAAHRLGLGAAGPI